MDFEIVLKSIIRDFINNGIRYALIGGYALGILGISRNTFDLDFLVDKRDKNKIKNILSNYQYEIKYESENVIQFVSILKVFGEIDVIYAFRSLSLQMLNQAIEKDIFGGELTVKLLRPEDIIAFKLQAIKNDQNRFEGDLFDIKEIINEKKSLTQDEWIKLNDIFNRFVNHRMKPFKRIRDNYMIL